MEIILNNSKELIATHDTMTVNELLAYKNFTFKMLVIKINNVIVKKADYSTAIIRHGDDVMVLHLISGG